MTARATFGDFAAAVGQHLDQMPAVDSRHGDTPRPASDADEFTRSLRSVLAVMTRYADSISAVFVGVPAADRRRLAPWIRAASRSRESLDNATVFLQPGPADTGRPRSSGPAACELDAAARSMTLARDLLNTHVAARPGGARLDRSEWAPAVTSVPVARALLFELAGWARQIAPHGGQLAVTAMRGTPQTRHRLNAACQWLWVLDWAVEAAHQQQPVTGPDVQLLHAIPVNALSPRHLPDGRESVTSLCQGTIDSAERVRHAARTAIPHASWSPSLTMESLRETAGYCTVISCNCEILLHTLAEHAERKHAAGLSAQLAKAEAAAGDARMAWLRAAGGWDTMTTDTRSAISQTAAEAADLALWTGRLAYENPAWTPGLGPSHPARTPESLAPEAGDLPRVVAAVHHVCQTLTQLAAADHSQLRTAAKAGRLLVPTRSLPERFDVPHHFAPAPGARVEPLLTAYDNARNASEQATADVAHVASAVRAPSQILTFAQGANEAGYGLPPAGERQPASETPAQRRPIRELPGPVERVLRDLDVTNPAALQRASALDQAAEQLILESARAAGPARGPAGHRALSTSAATAELINHMLASGDRRLAAVLHPPEPKRALQAEIEP